MTLPTVAQTWIISPNNRIPFVTVNDTVSKYLFGLKQFLVANGYTVKGSSNGVTASPNSTLITDGVDRWVTAANVTTRASVTGAAQSWIVLHDGNGVDILLTYLGSTDDVFRVAYSVGNLWTTQATGTFQPTATDAVIVTTGSSMVASSGTISDRIWFGWVDSTNKLCRFCVASAGGWVGSSWAVELFTPEIAAGPAAITPSIWGHCINVPSAPLLNGTSIGITRAVVASTTSASDNVYFGMEWTGLASNILGIIKPELQGAPGYPIYPLGLAVYQAVRSGKIGMLIDWWQGRTDCPAGVTYGNNQFIAVGCVNANGAGNCAGMWPWDGATIPVLT